MWNEPIEWKMFNFFLGRHPIVFKMKENRDIALWIQNLAPELRNFKQKSEVTARIDVMLLPSNVEHIEFSIENSNILFLFYER